MLTGRGRERGREQGLEWLAPELSTSWRDALFVIDEETQRMRMQTPEETRYSGLRLEESKGHVLGYEMNEGEMDGSYGDVYGYYLAGLGARDIARN